jgi:hypothetical protein
VAWAEQVLGLLFIEGDCATHVGADLGEGDNSFMSPGKSLCIEIKFFRAKANQEDCIFANVIECALLPLS